MKKVLNKNLIIIGLISLLSLCCQYVLGINDGSRYASNSKLSTGKWIKLNVQDNAIYKLTYDDIKGFGIEDPSKVNVYGYGGWVLDENFRSVYVDDLPEVAVWLSKGSDGIFGPGDYLLFYGRGTTKWTYNSSVNEYVHQQNPYSSFGCYFLTQGERGPKEMPEQASIQGAVDIYSVFDDYVLWEEDDIPATNASSGRELFSKKSFMDNPQQVFTLNMPGITSAPGRVRLNFAANVPNGARYSGSLSIDGKTLVDKSVYSTVEQYRKGNMLDAFGAWPGDKAERIDATVQFSGSNPSFAALNYIRINAERELKSYGEPYTFFRKKESRNKTVTYNIKNAGSSLLVFNVTGNFDTKLVKTAVANNELSFGVKSNDTLQEFVLADPARDFPKPTLAGIVENQNLHALPQTEMVIIIPNEELFIDQAEVLAEEHRKRDNLHVTVVPTDWIYNEFSSGVYDASAYRRFMKMFYDRAGANEADKPRYLLLFGDGVFDNRFISTPFNQWRKDNFLLTYQVRESLNEAASCGTDDYFGFLDDDDIAGSEMYDLGNGGLDIGIGRFPVRTGEEAKTYLEKLVRYMDNSEQDPWKNTACFSSDDTDYDQYGNPRFNFIDDVDQLADIMETNYPEYRVEKVYMDAYKPSFTGGSETYPGAFAKQNQVLKDGCFLYNYVGHGSTRDLSSEHMINMDDINQMSFTTLPIWITATCDFGWFDAANTSAGETVFLHKKSAGIALFTTTRVVYEPNNLSINKQLIKYLFDQSGGEYQRLGDVFKNSKNELKGDDNKLNYILLGDPALRLNYPKSKVELQTANGQPVDGRIFEFKALEQVTLTGVIKDPSGNVDTGFNGVLHTTVFDGLDSIYTYVKDLNKNSFMFTDYPSVVFGGNDSVKNGTFTVTFKVPLDIAYSDNMGKISFYASDRKNGNEAKGGFLEYKLNGTSEVMVDDTLGPEINIMYLNATTFQPMDAVNATPYFCAEMYDESGINMSGSGLGHDITITIDNEALLTYNLNSYFQSKAVEGEGMVQFSIPTLSPGSHELVFRVWDLLNNSSTDSLKFYVDPGLKPQMYDLKAVPNPARERTVFWFSHDRPETPLDIEITIYDLSGRLVWQYREANLSGSVEWDLTTGKGRRVEPGVYIYRAAIRTAGSQETTEAKKIIVLGQ